MVESGAAAELAGAAGVLLLFMPSSAESMPELSVEPPLAAMPGSVPAALATALNAEPVAPVLAGFAAAAWAAWRACISAFDAAAADMVMFGPLDDGIPKEGSARTGPVREVDIPAKTLVLEKVEAAGPAENAEGWAVPCRLFANPHEITSHEV
jgi:hypothetical protein